MEGGKKPEGLRIHKTDAFTGQFHGNGHFGPVVAKRLVEI